MIRVDTSQIVSFQADDVLPTTFGAGYAAAPSYHLASFVSDEAVQCALAVGLSANVGGSYYNGNGAMVGGPNASAATTANFVGLRVTRRRTGLEELFWFDARNGDFELGVCQAVDIYAIVWATGGLCAFPFSVSAKVMQGRGTRPKTATFVKDFSGGAGSVDMIIPPLTAELDVLAGATVTTVEPKIWVTGEQVNMLRDYNAQSFVPPYPVRMPPNQTPLDVYSSVTITVDQQCTVFGIATLW